MRFLVSRDEELRINSFDSAGYDLATTRKLDGSSAEFQFLWDR